LNSSCLYPCSLNRCTFLYISYLPPPLAIPQNTDQQDPETPSVYGNGQEPGKRSTVTSLPAGRPGFEYWQGQRFFLSVTFSRPALGFAHSPTSSAEVKNVWSCTSTPPYVPMAWWLIKHRKGFTFYFILQ